MIRTSPHPFSPLRKAAVCAAAALLALAGCDERLAGTSVGTGNPTEIQVGFTDGQGNAELSGRVGVYASTQIPVEGYRPEPLLSYKLDDADYATLKSSDFAALPDSVWSKGSIEKGIRSFNVVVMGDSQGSVLAGFGFDKAKGRFVLRPEDAGAVWDEASERVRLKDSLRALVDLKGTMDTVGISPYKDYHLFFYGMGFASKVDNGSFIFRGVPDGKYDAYLISLPHKDQPGTTTDSTEIFSTTAPLSTETSSLTRGELHERTRLPDSLIHP